MELRMKFRLFIVATALMYVVCSSAGFAGRYGWWYQGQYRAPQSLSNRTALPECGFAATQNFGPNGFQWCDSKNMYPRPRSGRSDRRWITLPALTASAVRRLVLCGMQHAGDRRHGLDFFPPSSSLFSDIDQITTFAFAAQRIEAPNQPPTN
jgi:hypothetical protein